MPRSKKNIIPFAARPLPLIPAPPNLSSFSGCCRCERLTNGKSGDEPRKRHNTPESKGR